MAMDMATLERMRQALAQGPPRDTMEPENPDQPFSFGALEGQPIDNPGRGLTTATIAEMAAARRSPAEQADVDATMSGIPNDWASRPDGTIFAPDANRQLKPINPQTDPGFLSDSTGMMPESVSTFKQAGPMLSPGVGVPAMGSGWDVNAKGFKDKPGEHTMVIQNGSQAPTRAVYGGDPNGKMSIRSLQVGGPQGPQMLTQPGGTQSEFEAANQSLEQLYNKTANTLPGFLSSGAGAAGTAPAGGAQPGLTLNDIQGMLRQPGANRWTPTTPDDFQRALAIFNQTQSVGADAERARAATMEGQSRLQDSATKRTAVDQADQYKVMRQKAYESELMAPDGYNPARLQQKWAAIDALAQQGRAQAGGATGQPTGIGGPPATGGNALQVLGSDLHGGINKLTGKQMPIADALGRVWQQHEANPGWFDQNRDVIMNSLKAAYGDKLTEAADQTGMGNQLQGIWNRISGRQPSASEKGSNAMARELGLSYRRGEGALPPIAGGDAMNPNAEGTQRRLMQIVGGYGLGRLAGPMLGRAGGRLPWVGKYFGGATGVAGAPAALSTAGTSSVVPGGMSAAELSAALGNMGSSVAGAGGAAASPLVGAAGRAAVTGPASANVVEALTGGSKYTTEELYRALLSMGAVQ